jgi:hypothetical protein
MLPELERVSSAPLAMTVWPVYVFSPVKVWEPPEIVMPPDPFIFPKKTLDPEDGMPLVMVRVLLPSATDDEPFRLNSDFTEAPLVLADISKTLPLSATLLELAMLPDPDNARVPAEIIV